MKSGSEDEIFWPSYVDLMTGLFIIALVLFVFSYKALTAERDRLRVDAENYKRLRAIDDAIASLANTQYFEYQAQYKRYVLRKQVQFETGKDEIAPKDLPFMQETGEELNRLISTLRQDPSKQDTRYMIIIEGMSSRDSYSDNFGLSYRRALALYEFWKKSGIDFDPKVCECEVIVAGSGLDGVGRYTGSDEAKNQRFLIQIVPKVAYH
jgi:outer membrane protein OmpA-like peptidoglycan-associated protein